AEVPPFARLVESQQALGLGLDLLAAARAGRAVAPAWAESVLAASSCPTDGHANPTATVHAFASAALRHGATIRTGTEVTEIDASGGRVRGVETGAGRIAADRLVIAAGVPSDAPRRMGGLALPPPGRHAP